MNTVKNSDYLTKLSYVYFYAKKYVIKKGYAEEIDWQNEVSFENITSEVFLKECAWVILSAGFKEKVISKIFSSFSQCFYNWENLELIIKNKDACFNKAIKVFSNEKKVLSIISIAELINTAGFNKIKQNIKKHGIIYLESLPFIGPVTKFHLAKNIGLCYSKPDRHLMRVTKVLDFYSVHSLCESIASYTNEKESVVDIVIWRYATLNPNYLRYLKSYLNKKYSSRYI